MARDANIVNIVDGRFTYLECLRYIYKSSKSVTLRFNAKMPFEVQCIKKRNVRFKSWNSCRFLNRSDRLKVQIDLEVKVDRPNAQKLDILSRSKCTLNVLSVSLLSFICQHVRNTSCKDRNM